MLLVTGVVWPAVRLSKDRALQELCFELNFTGFEVCQEEGNCNRLWDTQLKFKLKKKTRVMPCLRMAPTTMEVSHVVGAQVETRKQSLKPVHHICSFKL